MVTQYLEVYFKKCIYTQKLQSKFITLNRSFVVTAPFSHTFVHSHHSAVSRTDVVDILEAIDAQRDTSAAPESEEK